MKSVNNSLSIGIPTYNQSNFLRETIVSLLNQETPPFEIVVSNNHSTDQTIEVLEEFKGQIRVIQPHQHLDMMENWNFLVKNLKGSWFSLLSSDDVAKPNFVRVLLNGIDLSPQAVLVRAGWENIDLNGNVLEQRYLLSVERIVSPPDTLYENLLGPKGSFAAFAARHDAWEKVGGFPTNCSFFGDWAFWIKLSPLGHFIYQHELISGYRTNYRPGLELTRLFREIKDELEINLKVIPETSKYFENINHVKIKKACRIRFLRKLRSLSNLKGKDKISEIENLMLPWAKLVGCTSQLESYVNGKVFYLWPTWHLKFARYLLSIKKS